MLISFLATLDDGVYFSSEVARKQIEARKSSAQADGSAKLPSLASLLGLDLSASGKYARDKSTDDSTESKFVKQHTSASLFNRLRSRLLQDNLISQIRSGEELSDVSTGAVVEISGQLNEVPLKRIVDLFSDMWTFIEQQAPVGPELTRRQRDALSQEQRQELEIAELARQAAAAQLEQNRGIKQMVDLVGTDLAKSPVVDLILKGNGLSALVTASRESLSDDVTASLLGGTFTILGKVTAVRPASDAETIVVRRGAMGAVAEASILPMLEQMNENGAESGLNLDLPDGKISGPYLQVIPLAIFV